MDTEIQPADGVPDATVGDTTPPEGIERRSEIVETLRSMSTTAVVLGATLIVLSILHPNLILRNNTPTGGDMGAHVWGPAYLRDVLLPHFRLTGWSMDWYSGLPAYRFYMVVPALFIVILNLVIPYGIAFKLVVVAGLVAFPFCAWFMGRIAKLAYPLPELMAVGATMFLLDESFTIYGGNIASTMAGEFSHSIAFAFSIVGLGLFARGLDDGRHRGWAAVFIALAAVSHGIVLLFVFGGAVVMVALRPDRQRLRFAAGTIGTAVLLSAFWVVPFLFNHAFMTDMKYGSEPGGGSFKTMWDMYFPLSTTWDTVLMGLAAAGFLGSILRRRHLGIWMGTYAIVLAVGVKIAQGGLPVIGLLWNPRILPFLYLLRYMLAAIGVYEVFAYVRSSIALQRDPQAPQTAPGTSFGNAVLWTMTAFCLVVVGVRYQALPFASLRSGANGTSYSWGPLRFPAQRAFSDGWARWNFEGYEGKSSWAEYHGVVEQMKALGKDPSHGCGRALWENNGDLNKYGTTMALMLLPYWTKGCIGSMEGLYFEASGTTPYHFIAAAALSKQSSNPVRELHYDNNDAELGTRYMRLLGIRYYMAYTPEAVAKADAVADLVQVAVSGPWHVYEIADTALVEPVTKLPAVVNERPGDRRERWLEVGTSYMQHPDDWSVLPVADGPEEWQRIDVKVDTSRSSGATGDPGHEVDVVVPATANLRTGSIAATTVTNIVQKNESISFDVSRTGVPVVVKVSYFPNWQVKGAAKVYRAAPNYMVVVPTDKHVELTFRASQLDRSGYFLTFVGLVIVGWMFRRRWHYGTSLPPRTPADSLEG